MVSDYQGRRVMPSGLRRGAHRSGRKDRCHQARRKPSPPKEYYRIMRMVISCGLFVLLVALKLVFPEQMAWLSSTLSDMLEQNVDVRAVFSSVGHAFAEEGDMKEIYQTVFGGEGVPGESVLIEKEPSAGSDAAKTLQNHLEEQNKISHPSDNIQEAGNIALIQYSEQNVPDCVSMQQDKLGFSYCSPLDGTLTSGFGYREHPVKGKEHFHYGVDLAAEEGTAIKCFAAGTVSVVGESSSYGKYCIISHENGYETLYAHCSRIIESQGQMVKEGQPIAEVGKTGMTTGPHLHFELHRDGVYLNPIYYVAH